MFGVTFPCRYRMGCRQDRVMSDIIKVNMVTRNDFVEEYAAGVLELSRVEPVYKCCVLGVDVGPA